MMSFSAQWLQLVFLLLGGVLLLIALGQTITAWRHGARMPLTAITSALFLVGVGVIVMLTWSALTSVDWAGSFDISSPLNYFHLSF